MNSMDTASTVLAAHAIRVETLGKWLAVGFDLSFSLIQPRAISAYLRRQPVAFQKNDTTTPHLPKNPSRYPTESQTSIKPKNPPRDDLFALAPRSAHCPTDLKRQLVDWMLGFGILSSNSFHVSAVPKPTGLQTRQRNFTDFLLLLFCSVSRSFSLFPSLFYLVLWPATTRPHVSAVSKLMGQHHRRQDRLSDVYCRSFCLYLSLSTCGQECDLSLLRKLVGLQDKSADMMNPPGYQYLYQLRYIRAWSQTMITRGFLQNNFPRCCRFMPCRSSEDPPPAGICMNGRASKRRCPRILLRGSSDDPPKSFSLASQGSYCLGFPALTTASGLVGLPPSPSH
ncbi:hypothetical protein ACRALDRAFT_205435 [Sodiomyces alcalophilus JCM 7366]|uniref:uncharacterized protein n=1 Tax=Sodiomyces alcalophilus JCM 7366 TaxID=591952 RepID=UPI0039B4F7F2